MICEKHGVILYGNTCLNCEREHIESVELVDSAEKIPSQRKMAAKRADL